MTEGLDKCLKRLATDHVDLFYVHGINDFNEIARAQADKTMGFGDEKGRQN